MAHLATTS